VSRRIASPCGKLFESKLKTFKMALISARETVASAMVNLLHKWRCHTHVGDAIRVKTDALKTHYGLYARISLSGNRSGQTSFYIGRMWCACEFSESRDSPCLVVYADGSYSQENLSDEDARARCQGCTVQYCACRMQNTACVREMYAALIGFFVSSWQLSHSSSSPRTVPFFPLEDMGDCDTIGTPLAALSLCMEQLASFPTLSWRGEKNYLTELWRIERLEYDETWLWIFKYFKFIRWKFNWRKSNYVRSRWINSWEKWNLNEHNYYSNFNRFKDRRVDVDGWKILKIFTVLFNIKLLLVKRVS